MQSTREMTDIGVRVLKNARNVSKCCRVRTRYKKSTRLCLNCAAITLSASDRSWQNKKKERKQLPYAANLEGAKLTRAREWGSELSVGEGGGGQNLPFPAYSAPMKSRITKFLWEVVF